MHELPKVAVHIAVHNRLEYTLECISKLTHSATALWELHFFVADSGNDSLHLSLASKFEESKYTYIKVNPNSYWAESMHACMEATNLQKYNYILMINNDVFVHEDAISIISRFAEDRKNSITIGQLWDPATKSHAYGGLNKVGIHPLHYKSVVATSSEINVDALQGNCVLIPIEVIKSGIKLDPEYRHNYADLDFGVRAKKSGFNLIVAPGYIGTCVVGDRKLPNNILARIRYFSSPVGTPIKSQIKILKFLGPRIIWWIWLLPPIIRVLIGIPPKSLKRIV